MVLKQGERAEIRQAVAKQSAAGKRALTYATTQRRVETTNQLALKADVTVTDALDARLDVTEAEIILQAATDVDHEGRIATLEVAGGGAAAPNEETGATYTFALSDAGVTVVFNSATAQAITIPTDAAVAIPVGSRIRCFRKGVGLPTIAPDIGVTLHKPAAMRPNRVMGAMAILNSNQTAANYTAGAMITWGGADPYDTDGFHDPSSNNTKHIIPAGLGITKVAVQGNAYISSVTSNVAMDLAIYKNNARSYNGLGANVGSGANTVISFQARTAVIPATAADYFEQWLVVLTDSSITLEAAHSNFSIEVVEIEPVGSICYQYGYVTLEKIGADEWSIEGPGLG